MGYLKIVLFFFIYPNICFAQDLMEQKLFQLSGHKNLKHFLLKKPQKPHEYFNLNISGLFNQDLPQTLNKLNIEEESEIANFLSQNFGQPQYGLTKNSLGINIYNFSQEFSLSGGVLAKAQNPIIPELMGLYVEDLSTSSSFRFNWKDIYFTPKITLGKRKYKSFLYNAGDFIEDTPEIEINNIEAKNFIEGSLLLEGSNWFINFQSLPINGFFPQDYWEIRVGGDYNLTSNLNLYASFAPIFASTSSWSRLVVAGVEYTPLSWANINLFYQNKELGAMVEIDLSLISLEAYFLTQRFDDYNVFKKDQAGISFSIKY